jgi:hypothetical protein
MFFKKNKIKFSAPWFFVESHKEIFPVPASKNVPDWFKKLKHSASRRTVKGCKPFLDSLTAGYILKCPTDIRIIKKYNNEKKCYGFSFEFPSKGNEYVNINNPTMPAFHDKFQLGEFPKLEKNKMTHVFKIFNPFTIKTPRGYSCLFVNLLNNADDRFEIIPGIVDTDTYPGEINFPIILNNEKYSGEYDFIIKKGTPFAQCIPFKREDWTMEIEPVKKNLLSLFNSAIILHSAFINTYRDKWWVKKIWK